MKGRIVEYIIGHAGRRIVRRKNIYGGGPRLDAADWALIEKIRHTGRSVNSDQSNAEAYSGGSVGAFACSMRVAEIISRKAARENSAFFNNEMLAYWYHRWEAEDALYGSWEERALERFRQQEELHEKRELREREQQRLLREKRKTKEYKDRKAKERELARERRHWLDQEQKLKREAQQRRERWKKEEPDWGLHAWIVSTALPFDQAMERFQKMRENGTTAFQIIFCDQCSSRFQSIRPNVTDLEVQCRCGNLIDIRKVGCNFLPG